MDTFVIAIRREEFLKSRDFNILCDSGGASLNKKKRRNAKEHNNVLEATKLLDAGKITVVAFLSV